MKHLDAPCSNCPFLKKGGIRLRRDRLKDLIGNDRGTFSCHKTVKRDDNDTRVQAKGEAVCGGWLIFMEKTGLPNQMMRIGHTLGMYKPTAAKQKTLVFDSVKELLATADDAPKARSVDTGEPCSIANEGCEAPAGWGGAGGSIEDNPEANAEFECAECSGPVCMACSVEASNGTERICADCDESRYQGVKADMVRRP